MQTGSREVGREDAVMAKPEMLAQIRKRVVEYILQNTEDVGERFPRGGAGDLPQRGAGTGDPRQGLPPRKPTQLREEGIEVFTLPGSPVPPERLH